MTICGLDISTRGMAYCLRVDDRNPTIGFVSFAESSADDVQQRLNNVRDVLQSLLGQWRHYGQIDFRLELPSLNTGSPGAAVASSKAMGFTYAVWGILVAGNNHRAKIIHNATWKKEFKERNNYPKGISNKEQIVNAVEAVMPSLANTIKTQHPKTNQQDIFDAVGIAYGVQ